MRRVYGKFFKRFIDVLLSVLLLLFLTPLFLIVMVLIKLDSQGPVFFKQRRFGYKGKIFSILKFRTMFDKKRKSQSEVFLNNPEITRIGKYLRRFKIDELPQLINVLIGDMSLVGPRPGLVEQLNSLNDIGKKRLKVRPGLTGYAQINGNIFLPWEIRWKYDAYYVDNLSFWLDLKIIMKTILVIIFGEQVFVKGKNL